jgi:hypothetical protein
MPTPTLSSFLNSALPVPEPGYQNAKPQTDGASPLQSVSISVPSTGGAAVKLVDYTATANDCGSLLVFEASSSVTLSLPAIIPFAQWTLVAANIGAGLVTISSAPLLLDGTTTPLVLTPSQSVSIATDGTNYFSARGSGTGGGSETSTTHAESLTDGLDSFIFAGGDVVTVVGVSN